MVKQKKIHLTKEQIEQKIQGTLEKVEQYKGSEHKRKRQNLYAQIVKLKKALEDPENFQVDPIEKQKKIQKDKVRRVSKKLLKKKEKLLEKKKEYNRSRKLNYGHSIKDCTQREKDGVAVKICYKCGSNDHNLDDCGSNVEGLPFASCFICQQKGHLSKDCDQAKNGIFYRGGGCYFCGSNQHKKQDCPKLNNKKDVEFDFDDNQYFKFKCLKNLKELSLVLYIQESKKSKFKPKNHMIFYNKNLCQRVIENNYLKLVKIIRIIQVICQNHQYIKQI